MASINPGGDREAKRADCTELVDTAETAAAVADAAGALLTPDADAAALERGVAAAAAAAAVDIIASRPRFRE